MRSTEAVTATRRGFFAAASGFALDPERLLWRPGAKLISIPKAHAGLLIGPQYRRETPGLLPAYPYGRHGLYFHPVTFVLQWPAIK